MHVYVCMHTCWTYYLIVSTYFQWRKEYIGYSEDKQSLMLVFDEFWIYQTPPHQLSIPLTCPEVWLLSIIHVHVELACVLK